MPGCHNLLHPKTKASMPSLRTQLSCYRTQPAVVWLELVKLSPEVEISDNVHPNQSPGPFNLLLRPSEEGKIIV